MGSHSYKYCICFTRRFRWSEAPPAADVKAAFADYADADGGARMTADGLRRFLEERQEYTGAGSERAPRSGSWTRCGGSDTDTSRSSAGHRSRSRTSTCSSSQASSTRPSDRRTFTSPVPLIKCLRSIRENAFIASPYPVIITLEDHLTPDLQAKVAKMVIETFGNMLYYPPSESSQYFPSPEDLKNKIIISTKPPREYLESKDNEVQQRAKVAKEDEEWGKEVPDIRAELESADKIDDEVDDHEEDDGKKINQSIPMEYKRLITIRAGKPKGHIRDALKVEPDKVRRLSLSEQQLLKAAQSHGTDIVRFTQRNILRIYPKGTRFDSSNYNPFIGWIHGAQMVAFNMQGHGKSLWWMHGFFSANGGCGYVKQPDFLMMTGPNNEVFDPNESLPVKKTLKVRVYMGDGWIADFRRTHFDAYSPPDFYTRIGIAGNPADEIMWKTKIVEDDWAPVWDQEFTFPLTVPELALLRIEVQEYDMSEKDDFGGQTCLPVSELKPGFRSVPLYNRRGNKYKSVRLFMRFDFVS